MSESNIYQVAIAEAARQVQSDLRAGLTAGEAVRRLSQTGPNQLQEAAAVQPFQIFIGQFKDFVIWVLIVAGLISGFLQEWVDALAIIAIVIMNAVLGFVQEYRAERSLAALKKLSSPNSKVVRDGQQKLVPSAELVPGDLVELEAGDRVPADGRLVWLTANFSVQEASLTGESTPVAKTVQPLEGAEVPLADRLNMVYMGTVVASGRGRALLTATGMRTELGRIAGMIQTIAHNTTPLQKKLEEFGKWIVYLCFVIVALIFALGLWRGGKLIDVFLTAVSLAVAAIPEGLPAVVTIALALGVQRMVGRHALIRKLPSVETLGCATVICSDKTGTLTKNEMTVKHLFVDGTLVSVSGAGYEPKGEFSADGQPVDPQTNTAFMTCLRAGVLCNSASLTEEKGEFRIAGDPTEGALLTAGAKAGLWKDFLEKDYEFVEEIPFDSDRKKMTVIRRKSGRLTAFVKGAPDLLLADCTKIVTRHGVRPLTAEDRQEIVRANDGLAHQAMRVLAVACRDLDDGLPAFLADSVERDLAFVGLIAMIDPPREEVKEAVTLCRRAGIETVMITGDHKNTAVAIARQLGFFKNDSMAFSGAELDKISDEELARTIRRIPVYARVSPEHKLRIVRAWRKQGEVVAMTGDGVNDAPAVKEADIGVAMGITGTDVTKEVSDMVVTDDNFASIVAAVEEGRGIYDNIKKFVHYLLSCNTGEILVIFVASLSGWPTPLLPVQILWVNLVTDGFPALALGMDPVDPHIMDRPPRKPSEPVVTTRRAIVMLAQGMLIASCSLLAFGFILFQEGETLERARTAAFMVLACAQLFHAFNCRHMTESLFSLGIMTNRKLVAATTLSFVLQLAVVHVPWLRGVFKTEPLSGLEWIVVIAVASFPLVAMEGVKLINRKFGFLKGV